MKKFTLIDIVTMLGIAASVLLVLMYATGCSHTPAPKDCCKRLDVRTDEMRVFNRYCTMLVFANRKEADPKVLEDIKHRLDLCKFVFAVETADGLLSLVEEDTKPQRVRYYKTSAEDMWWNPPIDCHPDDIGCEEF
jgi:hypothetical protein